MALIDEIMEQTVKLKDMDTKGKIDYIWHYYKWYFVGIIAGIACLTSMISAFVKNNKPVYLFAEFINCNLAFDDTSTMEDDFITFAQVDINNTPVMFDYNTVLQDNGFDGSANYTTQMRIVAEYNAKELDIVCAPESLLTGSLNIGAYGNFEEIFSKETLDELKSKGYELWTYTEPVDDEEPDVVPKTYIAGIYIDTIQYMSNQGMNGVYTVNNGDRPILTVSCTSQNIDHCVEFIKMVTDMN